LGFPRAIAPEGNPRIIQKRLDGTLERVKDDLVNATPPTILYIEDDAASRLLVERCLRFAGYHVLVAERGLQGIDIARQELPDMILTDINLPDLSGREVTTTLRADPRFAHTPIVALTALIEGQQRALTMAAGANGYITKPIDVELFADQVAAYLKGARDKVDEQANASAQTAYLQEVTARLENRMRALEASNRELTRLDRMKDTFIQVTAHELRTPLTLVYGYDRLLEELPAVQALAAADPNVHYLIKGLGDGINRMQSIVNEILTITRIVTNQVDISIGMVNPAAVAASVIDGYIPAMKNRMVKIHFDRAQWPVRLQGDGDLLRLLLSNLLSNAIKYTPDGGEVTLEAYERDEQVVMIVRDTGIGVAHEDRELIFERFHTTSDTLTHSTSKTAFRGGGLGLGLAVCKGIVEAHQGSIRVESPGFDLNNPPGSAFIVTLPLNTARTQIIGAV